MQFFCFGLHQYQMSISVFDVIWKLHIVLDLNWTSFYVTLLVLKKRPF